MHSSRSSWSTVCLCAFLFSTVCAAQDVGVTLIESTGTGTVHGVPTHVDFWVHREVEGESNEAAIVQAERLEGELLRALEEAKTPRVTLEVTGPAVSDLDKKWAVSSARMRFTVVHYGDSAKTVREFGMLCDKVAAAAASVGGTLRGPQLDTSQRDALMKQAVKLAIENAYPAAEAASEALKSSFYSVDSVRITSITWNRTPDSEAPEPNLRRISCTAELRVVYAVTPKP